MEMDTAWEVSSAQEDSEAEMFDYIISELEKAGLIIIDF